MGVVFLGVTVVLVAVLLLYRSSNNNQNSLIIILLLLATTTSKNVTLFLFLNFLSLFRYPPSPYPTHMIPIPVSTSNKLQ